MSVKERTQDLNMVVELVRTHLPENLKDNDLCKDICSVVAINLRRVNDDAEQSAKAWDKRTFHSKADDLRTEIAWALPLAQIAEAMAYTPKKFDATDCARLNDLLPDFLEMPLKQRFKDVTVLRGAAAAARSTLLKRK
jgi:hypothetical protein